MVNPLDSIVITLIHTLLRLSMIVGIEIIALSGNSYLEGV